MNNTLSKVIKVAVSLTCLLSLQVYTSIFLVALLGHETMDRFDKSTLFVLLLAACAWIAVAVLWEDEK